MADYFDPEDTTNDTVLLSSRVRTHSELSQVAAEAEADVIRAYTVRGHITDAYQFSEGGFDYSTTLRGYKPDAEDADGGAADRSTWTGFAKAMRLTIAKVISHRLIHYNDDPTLKSEGRGSRSVSRFRGSYNEDWPMGWRKHLKLYDIRPPVHTI